MPAPLPQPQCKGYLLGSQLATADSTAPQDPYAIVPCPHPPLIPSILSEGCKDSKKKRACGAEAYCQMHWCGPCKKAMGIVRPSVARDEEQGAGWERKE